MSPARSAILRNMLLTYVCEHVDSINVSIIPRSGELIDGNVDTGLERSFRRSVFRSNTLEAGFFTRNLNTGESGRSDKGENKSLHSI